MTNKFLIVSIVAILTFSYSYSQTEKGNFIVGISTPLNLTGNSQIGYSTQKRKGDGFETEAEKVFAINLTPRIGFFPVNNFALGLDFNLGYAKLTSSLFSGGDIKTTQIMVMPFARYYLTSSQVKPFFECAGGIGSSNIKFDDDSFDTEQKSGLLSLGGAFGIASKLGNIITLDTSIGYVFLQEKEKDNNPSNEKLITNALRLNFGFSIFLD